MIPTDKLTQPRRDYCSYMFELYHSIFPLNKTEVKFISTLIASRLTITVIMAAKQKKKYPDNQYLSISENDAWDLLQKLNDINLEKLTYNLLKTCKYE